MSKIIRITKERNYSMMDNTFIRDERLSWKATGLMAYLLHLPDNWEINTKDLTKRKTDGRTSLLSGLKELREFGYVEYKRVQNSGGMFEHVYVVIENPSDRVVEENEPQPGNPLMVEGEPQPGFPPMGNPPIQRVLTEVITKKDLPREEKEIIEPKKPKENPKPKALAKQEEPSKPKPTPSKARKIINKPSGAATSKVDTMMGMTDEFAKRRPALNVAIHEYFRKRIKDGLKVEQWEVILSDIDEYLPNDKTALAEIEKSTQGGYMQVVPRFMKKSGVNIPPARARGDNTAENTFQANEDLDIESKLAVDEDGNPLTF